MLSSPVFRDTLFGICGYQKPQPVLAAVSGGVDSVVLCHLLQENEIPFAIAHVNYGLRGDESDGDENFVAELAKKKNVPFYLLRCTEKEFEETGENSTQSAARKIRYDFFRETAAKEGLAFIATAHHFDDSIETALLNFARGSGISGLKGIAPVNDNVIRPLLQVTRPEIIAYAEKNKLEWRNDSSNDGDNYSRNRFRHHLLPWLMTESPQGYAGLTATFSRVSEDDALRKFALHTWEEKCCTFSANEIRIDCTKAFSFPQPYIFLHAFLRNYNFTTTQLRAMDDFRALQLGAEFFSSTHRLSKDRDFIFITETGFPVKKEPGELLPPTFLEVTESAVPSEFRDDPWIAFVDAGTLDQPLLLRRWKPGDKFIPLGMSGHRKVSDILSGMKVPSHLKQNAPVVVSGNEIVWVPGYRIAEKFCVRETTEKVYRIKFDPGHYGKFQAAV